MSSVSAGEQQCSSCGRFFSVQDLAVYTQGGIEAMPVEFRIAGSHIWACAMLIDRVILAIVQAVLILIAAVVASGEAATSAVTTDLRIIEALINTGVCRRAEPILSIAPTYNRSAPC